MTDPDDYARALAVSRALTALLEAYVEPPVLAIGYARFTDPAEMQRLAADLRKGIEPSVRRLAGQLQQTLQRITDTEETER